MTKQRQTARQQHASALSGTRNQADPYSRKGEQSGAELAESQPGQRERERERERRVSDADASYNGPANSTWTLKHAIPQ